MKYKIFAIDLDGTLLNWKKSINNFNFNALKSYCDAGGMPVVITGRAPDSAKIYIKQIEKATNCKIKYLATLNGNIIEDLSSNEIIYSTTIPAALCEKLYHISLKYNLVFWPYTVEGIRKDYVEIYGPKSFSMCVQHFHKGIKIVRPRVYRANESYKINIINNGAKAYRLFKAYKYVVNNLQDELDIAFTSKWVFEVTMKNSNKGNAIAIIADRENIPLENVAAIGDSANDISMFKVVGHPIGAKNNNQVITEYVDYIVKDPGDESVAKAIMEDLIHEK